MTKGDRVLTHLRHVDLAVPDFEKQVEFYSGAWGLTKVAQDSGIAFLAAEGSPEQYIVRLRRGEKRLDLISYGAETKTDVDTLAERLSGAGVQLVSQPAELDVPGGGYGFRFFDIDGRTLEVSAGVAPRKHREIEERESIPVCLSHVVVNSPNITATRDWYVQHLDFALSDSIGSPHTGEVINFLRINPAHHTLGIGAAPHTALHHVSFELRGLDEYMRGTGRLLRSGAELIWGPGRHLAGDNTFSYFMDPHGNTVEYTTALEVIDEDTWQPHSYTFMDENVSDQWGTASPMSEALAKRTFNDPDPGVFVAPPI
jgi:catechol 2,3-dioxygenase-like lactoylglutathione lyase family enzyme